MRLSQRKTDKKFWGDEEDAELVESILELNKVGQYLINGHFKPGHLKELERLMEMKKPGCGLKGKPHIQSRLKTLKTHFQIIHDMVTGVNCSGFGWDSKNNFVVAEKRVWDTYVQNHKEAAYFRHRSFPYYEDLCIVYAKDLATRNQVETFTDVDRVEHDNYVEEEIYINGSVGNDDGSAFTFSQAQEGQPASSNASSKKRRKTMKVDDLGKSIEKASINLGFRVIESIVGQAFGHQEIYQKQKKLNEELTRTTTLSMFDRHKATELIGPNVAWLNVFFSIPDKEKDAYVRAFLSGSI